MRILIAEDNEDSRAILKKTLESEGYEVLEAANGTEALSIVKESTPDIIISDILMPGMDGFRLCHEVKADKKLRKIPFIFYTATYTDPKDERLALSLGASRFILKPVETDQFLKIIDEVLQEFKEHKLHVPGMPLEEESELAGMHEESLAKKVKKLEREREAFIEKETAFKESEKKFRLLSEVAFDGFTVTEKGKFLEMNEEFANIFGYTPSELIGNQVSIVVAPECLEEVMHKIQSGYDKPYETVCVKKDGSRFMAEVSGKSFPYEDRIMRITAIRDISERKKAEYALMESEERYRRITAAITDYIYTVRVENGMAVETIHSDACIAVTGYTSRKFADDPYLWIRMVLVEDHDLVRKQVEQVLSGQTPKTIEHRIARKDGIVRWVKSTIVPHYSAGGNLISYDGIVRDITERKNAEDQLKESENKFKDLVVKSLVGVYLIQNGVFKYCNPKLAEIFGYSVEELIGNMGPEDLVFPDDWPIVRDNLTKRLSGEVDSIYYGFRGITRNKEIIYVEVYGSKTVYQGHPAVIGSLLDVTERRKSENALMESEERFRTIFETTPVGISIADSKGKLIKTNHVFQRMLGYAEDELYKKFADVTHPDDIKKNLEFFREMVSGKRDSYRMEKRYIRKDGSIMWTNLTVTSVRDSNGNFKYNFAIIEDISERKKLEDQLRHSQKMEAVGQLAGGVAHDFNNLLTAIIGYGNLIKMKLKDDPQLLYNINQILEITARGASLTQGLLAFSRKQVITPRPTRLNDLIDRIGKLLPRLVGEEIEVKLKLVTEDLTVLVDGGQIEQVIMNLAANAHDAMPEGGTLTIETGCIELGSNYMASHEYGEAGVYALISISDTGVGMDEETAKKIFEPFFTTKDVGKGTGLGLAMAYGIIKQHNGYINVYSKLNKGTTFKIYLPMIDKEVEDKKPGADLYILGGTETILIAEDEVEVRESIKGILKEFGFTIIEAVNGEDAIEKFKENKDRIQLLIFDVVMPKKSGKTAYQAIKKLNPDIKVIFISGYTEKPVRSKGAPEDVPDFISKPFSPNDILKKIQEVLKK